MCLSTSQDQFLSELFELCTRYKTSGVLAVSAGIDKRFYLVKVELMQLAQSKAVD